MNNQISAKIVADSINSFGNRIITFELIYPRIIHAEVMTHRLFSRNASSSRAVPVNKMIEAVKNNMFCPFAFQKSHKGMQGSEYFEGDELEQAKQLWIESAELALQQAEKMEKFGITKQLINRILEPYQYYKVLLTATEFENFFELRCPQYQQQGKFYKSKKEAIKLSHSKLSDKRGLPENDLDWLRVNRGQSEIHIMQLAECMWDAMNESIPKQLKAGEWHLPYGDQLNKWGVLKEMKYNPVVSNMATADEMFEYYSLRIATAKAARVSYTTVGEDGKEIPYEKDIALHDSLLKSGHFSCFEHCAKAMSDEEYSRFVRGKVSLEDFPLLDDVRNNNVAIDELNDSFGWCNNFRGFIQYRYML
jgi:thymidylate synthase ThyX